MKPNKLVHTIAKKYCKTTRTVQRWIRDGAPVDDDAKLKLWLAGKRCVTVPKEAGVAPTPTTPTEIPSAEPGAPSALLRLEQAELAAYSRLQTATASGDALALREASRTYLETTEALRKNDLAIAKHRRAVGELVPRESCEKWLEMLAGMLRTELLSNVSSIAQHLPLKDEQSALGKAVVALRSLVGNRLLTLVSASFACSGEWRPPRWMLDAFVRDSANLFRGAPAVAEQRLALIRELLVEGDGPAK